MLLEYCSKCGTKVDDEAMQRGAVRVDADTFLCSECAKSNSVQAPARSSNPRTPSIPARSSNSKMAGVTVPQRSSNSRTPAVSQPRSSNTRTPAAGQSRSRTPPHGVKTAGAHSQKEDHHAPPRSVVPLLIIIICLGVAASGVVLLYGNPFQSPRPVEKEAGRTPPPAPEDPGKIDSQKIEEDPRERIAGTYLHEAKALIAEDQKNLKAYQQKLTDLKSKYGFTAAGKEADLLLQDPMFSAKTPEVLPPESAWEQSIDLLATADPSIDALRGTWSKIAKGIGVSDNLKGTSTLLVLPYVPPLEYDVRIQCMRKQGKDTLTLLIPRGNFGVAFMPSGYSGAASGFDRVNGKRVLDNPTTYKTKDVFRNNQTHTIIVQVREKLMKAYVDGKLISTCAAGPEDVSISAAYWTTPFLERLNIGSWESVYEIYKLQVIELSGKGKRLTSADRNKEFQKGLWASYFMNDKRKNFAKYYMGRPEYSIGFDIKDGTLDPEMPADRFSVRYGGLLRVDVPGTYKFSYSADDRIEVWLDGKSLGMRENQAWQKIDVELTAGDHPIRVDYTEGSGKASMQLLCIRPGDTVARSLPPGFLYFNPEKISAYQQPSSTSEPAK